MQQDNDPKHTAKTTKEFIMENKSKVWPSQSPDVNPIKHAFPHAKEETEGWNPPKQTTTERDSVKAWTTITKEECKSLVMSMGCRLDAVMQAKDLQLNMNYYSLFTLLSLWGIVKNNAIF